MCKGCRHIWRLEPSPNCGVRELRTAAPPYEALMHGAQGTWRRVHLHVLLLPSSNTLLKVALTVHDQRSFLEVWDKNGQRCPCCGGFRSRVVRLLVLLGLRNFLLPKQPTLFERRDPRREPSPRDTARLVDDVRREQVGLHELTHDSLRHHQPTDVELPSTLPARPSSLNRNAPSRASPQFNRGCPRCLPWVGG